MPEPDLAVLVVAADPLRGRALGQALRGQGLGLAGVAATAAAALAAGLAPDLVLLDLPRPGAADLETLRALGRPGWPLVLLCGQADQAFMVQAQAAGAQACLVGPQEPDALAAALDLAHQSHQREQRLVREVEALRDGLRQRKLLERAKGILMRQMGIGYAAAEARLAEQAARQRLTPQQAAAAVVEAAEGLSPDPRRYGRP
ncbi:MAG: ANTAR domain-containing protein [Pseudomonadota bacterium]